MELASLEEYLRYSNRAFTMHGIIYSEVSIAMGHEVRKDRGSGLAAHARIQNRSALVGTPSTGFGLADPSTSYRF